MDLNPSNITDSGNHRDGYGVRTYRATNRATIASHRAALPSRMCPFDALSLHMPMPMTATSYDPSIPQALVVITPGRNAVLNAVLLVPLS